nr:hypothetical protein [Tanacetum cinerariifolium]
MAKLALRSLSALAPTSSLGKNKSLIVETYEWDEEEVPSDGNEAIKVKALMALANEERVYVSKESASNGITLKEPSLAPAKDNKKGSSASKTFSAPVGKLKNVKIEDDPLLAIVMKELNELKLQLSKKKLSHSRNHQSQQTSQHHICQGESSLRSRPSRPVIFFQSCIHYRYNNHQSNKCVYYPICELCGSYDHDTHEHNEIIYLRRGIKPRNPQHVIKNYETCGSNVHTITGHKNIKWFRKGEAKKFRANKTLSSNVQRSKTPIQSMPDRVEFH